MPSDCHGRSFCSPLKAAPPKAGHLERTLIKWVLIIHDFTLGDPAQWVRSGRIVVLGGRAGPVLKADKVEM